MPSAPPTMHKEATPVLHLPLLNCPEVELIKDEEAPEADLSMSSASNAA